MKPFPWLAILLALAAGSVMSADASSPAWIGNTDAVLADPIDDPVSLQLSASGVSGDRRLIHVVAELEALVDKDTVTIRLLVPDGLHVIAGDTAWSGPLAQHASRRIEATLRADTLGYYEVRAAIEAYSYNAEFRSQRSLHAEVSPNGIIVESEPPNTWLYPSSGYGSSGRACAEGVVATSLSLPRVPALGDTFTVALHVDGVSEVESERMTLNLQYPPEGFDLIDTSFPAGGRDLVMSSESGNSYDGLTWHGPSVAPGETAVITATLRVVDVGEGWFGGGINAQPPFLQDNAAVVLHVDRYRSWAEAVVLPPPRVCEEVRSQTRARR